MPTDENDEVAEKIVEKMIQRINEEAGKSLLKLLGMAALFGLIWLAVLTGQIKFPGGH
jgi:hypothetical protein